MKWTEGNYIKKGDDKRKVLGVCGEMVFVSHSDNYEHHSASETQVYWERNGWSLVEEAWEPSRSDNYWTVSFDEDNGFREVSWMDDVFDRGRAKNGLVFKTQEEAQAMFERIMAMVKEGKV